MCMRFISQDPDIETIFRRIKEEDYDLQPDFQRGEVWPLRKKRRLIDSILRGWHIPPIHLVVRGDNRSDVLDGQQRLTAIRDFMEGQFRVDGKTEPQDERISALNGLKYDSLPADVARSFRKFTIRVFELVDYEPEEPHELFFRLNQPTSLTEAEKRNAFASDARNQVREIVEWAVKEELLTEKLGFTNARMAYDDMIARVLVTIEARSLEEKVTALRVTSRYRSGSRFSDQDVDAVKLAFQRAVIPILNEGLRPNRATLFTWLCAGAQMEHMALSGTTVSTAFPQALTHLEKSRWEKGGGEPNVESKLMRLFQDRSTARVADVSSVLLRDLILWMEIAKTGADEETEKTLFASEAWERAATSAPLEETLLSFADEVNWGELGWR